MNKTTIWVVFSILITTATILAIYEISHPKEPKNIEECKLRAWTDCKMPIVGNQNAWCYQIEGINSTKYENCAIISQQRANCWINASEWCFLKFVVKPAEKEKNNG